MLKGRAKKSATIGCASEHDANIPDTSADLHKKKVGPIHVYFEGDQYATDDAWWKVWHDVVHVTKFGPQNREFCNLSPHNRKDTLLDQYRGSRDIGRCNVDVVYVSA